MNRDKIEHIRNEYSGMEMRKKDMHPNPIHQFDIWLHQAIECQVLEPTAMTLATINPEGIIGARIVLLKEITENGFIFYTNYQSTKGRSLDIHNQASLVFFWKEMERQVRIHGKVEKVNVEKSLQYFQSRPRMSQLGAWCSPQSREIESREVLETQLKEVSNKFQNVDSLPLPPFWGGYVIIPDEIEFWQGRPSRLHDRIRYKKNNGQWLISRLAP